MSNEKLFSATVKCKRRSQPNGLRTPLPLHGKPFPPSSPLVLFTKKVESRSPLSDFTIGEIGLLSTRPFRLATDSGPVQKLTSRRRRTSHKDATPLCSIRYVPSPISQLIAILLALLSADAYTWSYSDADAAANAMSEMKHEKTDEQQSENLEAVTNFYRSAKPCVQLGEKELIIISIDSEGSVIDAVAQNSNEKTTCLLALISKFSFAKPPWQPYYLKVQM